MTGEVLLQAVRYNRWANLHLLEVCGSLSDRQLQLTSAGTYGSIQATWLHLLAAEQRYLRRLVGFQPQLSEEDDFPGIPALMEHARRSGDALLGAVGQVDPDGTSTARDGMAPRHWLVMTQALHHGNDHRTHICTILGQNDIAYGDMDVWTFGLDHDGYVSC